MNKSKKPRFLLAHHVLCSLCMASWSEVNETVALFILGCHKIVEKTSLLENFRQAKKTNFYESDFIFSQKRLSTFLCLRSLHHGDIYYQLA